MTIHLGVRDTPMLSNSFFRPKCRQYFRIRRQWLNGRGAQAPAALELQRFTKMDQGVVQQYRGVLSERDDIKGNKNCGQQNVKSPMERQSFLF